MNTRPFALTLIVCAGIALAASSPVVHARADSRTVAKTADDLPRRTYRIEGKSLDFLRNKAAGDALAVAVRKDLEDMLAKYKIEDTSTLRAVYDTLSTIAALRGEWDNALDWTRKTRELEVKESERLMRGVTMEARIAATRAAGGDESKFAESFKAELRRRIEAMPFDVVKDRLVAVRNQAKIVSKELVESSVSNQVDPVLEANKGEAPQEIAAALIATRFSLEVGLPLLPLMAEVYGAVIDAKSGSASTEDLWTPRLVTLPTSAPAKPVVIAVWDSGVDTSLYPDNLWTNPKEQANGKDDDGNGFVDDLHGIAFGPDHKPAPGPLGSLADLKGDKRQLMGFIAASQDMQAGISNAGVEAFQNYYKNLKGDALKQFTDDIGLLGTHVHGTHVAGVAVAGNPFARIVHITENWPTKSIPDVAPTMEEYRAWGESCGKAVDYAKAAGARVVNMSWRIGRSAVEGMLEAKGVGSSPEERAEMSRKIYGELRAGLERAIRSAPDILFIAGSGNEDNDVDFSEYIPAGLRLPNLITVGAVNHLDKFTSFTSTGKNVELYANGYRIESFMPGGQKVRFSGTSMAAPQVSNLAAKILALKPEMKPAEVVALIRANAEPAPGQAGRFVINPKKTIAALGVR